MVLSLILDHTEIFCQDIVQRRRKIFFSTGAQHNENKICVGGDVVLFIMFFINITTCE